MLVTTMFLTLPRTNFKLSVTFILSSVKALNLDLSKIKSFGKVQFICIIILLFSCQVLGECITILSVYSYEVCNKETNKQMHGRSIRSGQDSNQGLQNEKPIP